MTASVELRDVSKRFGDVDALANVTLKIEASEFAVLLGPSGCGKSTLLAVLGGFESPSAGRVLIGGDDVTVTPARTRKTTTMFQDYALFPHMSLADNVGFGLRMRGVPRADRRRRARELLELVGLPSLGDRKPHELSGGQRQRVALARCLAVEPDVLLLDEPLGALDLKLRKQMQDELKSIQRRVGTTFVHVTHDQEEAMAMADRIVLMNQGRIEDAGSPAEVYMNPRSRFAASFMGEINLIEGVVEDSRPEGIVVRSPLGRVTLPASRFGSVDRSPGTVVAIGIRPEHFRAQPESTQGGSPLDLGTARITDAAFFGTHHRCQLLAGEGQGMKIITHYPQESSLSAGDLVTMCVDGDRILVLASEE